MIQQSLYHVRQSFTWGRLHANAPNICCTGVNCIWELVLFRATLNTGCHLRFMLDQCPFGSWPCKWQSQSPPHPPIAEERMFRQDKWTWHQTMIIILIRKPKITSMRTETWPEKIWLGYKRKTHVRKLTGKVGRRPMVSTAGAGKSIMPAACSLYQFGKKNWTLKGFFPPVFFFFFFKTAPRNKKTKHEEGDANTLMCLSWECAFVSIWIFQISFLVRQRNLLFNMPPTQDVLGRFVYRPFLLMSSLFVQISKRILI